jgi:hypothetical protein
MNEKLTKDDLTNKFKKSLLSLKNRGSVDEMAIMYWQEMIDNRSQPGPWDNEPDELSFVEEVTKLECLILRNLLFGSLCGYIVFPEGKDLDTDLLEVHGGVTHSNFSSHPLHSSKYCIGFDCAHAYDWSPYAMSQTFAEETFSTYKDIEFVKAECRKLAKQLYDLKEKK